MNLKTIKEGNINVVFKYDRYLKTDRYEVYYNTETGFELVRGINNHKDPYVLDLPLLLDIGIMGHCKNKCNICYQGNKVEDHMKLEEFKMILDQTKHHLNQVALGGRGDPNHHPHFREIVEYCIRCGIIPNYTTSGIDLTDEQIEISKMCGAVAISDYDQVCAYDSIKRLQQADIKTYIHIVFTAASFDKCIKILYGHNPWKQEVNVDKIFAVVFLLFKPVGRGRYTPQLQPSPYQTLTFTELVLRNEALMDIAVDSCLVNKIKLTEEMKPFLNTCDTSKYTAYISPSLMMTPCSFVDSSLGDKIKTKRSIQYIWKNSKLFKEFRKKLIQKPNRCPIGLE